MTPIYYHVHDQLEREFRILDREKILHWLMHFEKGLNIDDCRGGRITLGGHIEFEGQVRRIFWSFIVPCLHDVVQRTLQEAEEQGRRYGPRVTYDSLDETQALLKSFGTKVYRRMVEIDLRLRGKGFPESVAPYDPSILIAAIHNHIDVRALAFKAQVKLPTRLQLLSESLERHRILVTTILALIGGAIGGLIQDVIRSTIK